MRRNVSMKSKVCCIKGFINEHKKTIAVCVVAFVAVVLLCSNIITGCELGQTRRAYIDSRERLESTIRDYRQLESELGTIRERTQEQRRAVQKLGEITDTNITRLSEAVQLIREIKSQVRDLEKYCDNGDGGSSGCGGGYVPDNEE